jgi:threonine dehydrogenase-like Zn-dependent dehydrogenase
MDQVVARGPRDYEFTRAPIPVPGAGEVLVRCTAVSVCGSDAKMYASGGGPDCFFWGTHGRVRSRPIVPGHEFVCEVMSVGPPGLTPTAADGLRVGDQVLCEQFVCCRGVCWHCRQLHFNKCDSLCVFGQGLSGAMVRASPRTTRHAHSRHARHATLVPIHAHASNPLSLALTLRAQSEAMILPAAAFVHRVDPPMPVLRAVLAEPLAIGLHAVKRLGDAAAASAAFVVVLGAGTIGHCVIAALRRASALPADAAVLVVDKHAWKLRAAMAEGASHSVQADFCEGGGAAGREAALARMRELGGERGGPDVVFECTGSTAGPAFCLDAVRKCGTVVHVGICGGGARPAANWDAVSAGKELNIVGCSLGHGAWPRAIELLRAGALSQLVTHVLPLASFQRGLELVLAPERCLKVVLAPAASVAAGAIALLEPAPDSGIPLDGGGSSAAADC